MRMHVRPHLLFQGTVPLKPAEAACSPLDEVHVIRLHLEAGYR